MSCNNTYIQIYQSKESFNFVNALRDSSIVMIILNVFTQIYIIQYISRLKKPTNFTITIVGLLEFSLMMGFIEYIFVILAFSGG